MQSSLWMAEALREAYLAEAKDEVPVGAVVVVDGKVVGRGHNLRESTKDPSSHAELLAIRDAAKHLDSWRLIGAEVYVTLEPCPMCLGAMQLARVSRVVYGAKDPKGGALSLGYALHQDLRLNHRFACDLESDAFCSDVLKDFFKKKRESST
jgi:tRNA(adenine34) deaminase